MTRWWKRLSRTDAQQPTKGWLVPYLRFTAGSGDSVDLKDHLFDALVWDDGEWQGKPVSEAQTHFEVADDGSILGNYLMRLTYQEERLDSHKHPALWLHWGDEISAHLQENDRDGWYVVIARDDNAVVPLSVSFQRNPPA